MLWAGRLKRTRVREQDDSDPAAKGSERRCCEILKGGVPPRREILQVFEDTRVKPKQPNDPNTAPVQPVVRHRDRRRPGIGREMLKPQCPSERKGEGVPVCRPARPFSRPQPPADRRQSAGLFAYSLRVTAQTDWLLEEARFELSVPPRWRTQLARRFTRYRRGMITVDTSAADPEIRWHGPFGRVSLR
jgi:hypothetical protein